MASEGGAPGVSPGVTTLGCGRAGSWTCQGRPGSIGVSVNPRSPGFDCCAVPAAIRQAHSPMPARKLLGDIQLLFVAYGLLSYRASCGAANPGCRRFQPALACCED